jgi:hypothetical protein
MSNPLKDKKKLRREIESKKSQLKQKMSSFANTSNPAIGRALDNLRKEIEDMESKLKD